MTTTPTTLEDVARLAGVSRATASRVLLRRGRFSQASRDQVEHAARQLGYVPNVLASDLASKTGPDTLGALSFSQIIWPETALPFFLTALKVASTLSLIGAIVGEYFGGASGVIGRVVV